MLNEYNLRFSVHRLSKEELNFWSNETQNIPAASYSLAYCGPMLHEGEQILATVWNNHMHGEDNANNIALSKIWSRTKLSCTTHHRWQDFGPPNTLEFLRLAPIVHDQLQQDWEKHAKLHQRPKLRAQVESRAQRAHTDLIKFKQTLRLVYSQVMTREIRDDLNEMGLRAIQGLCILARYLGDYSIAPAKQEFFINFCGAIANCWPASTQEVAAAKQGEYRPRYAAPPINLHNLSTELAVLNSGGIWLGANERQCLTRFNDTTETVEIKPRVTELIDTFIARPTVNRIDALRINTIKEELQITPTKWLRVDPTQRCLHWLVDTYIATRCHKIFIGLRTALRHLWDRCEIVELVICDEALALNGLHALITSLNQGSDYIWGYNMEQEPLPRKDLKALKRVLQRLRCSKAC
jgi:hypothetical protein